MSPGELLFSKGDIFHVYDTIPNGTKDVWRARRVNLNGEETEEGNVPLVHKLSSWMASVPSSFSSSLPNIFRIAFYNNKARLGSATGTENYDIDVGRNVYDLYQPVKRIKCEQYCLHNQTFYYSGPHDYSSTSSSCCHSWNWRL